MSISVPEALGNLAISSCRWYDDRSFGHEPWLLLCCFRIKACDDKPWICGFAFRTNGFKDKCSNFMPISKVRKQTTMAR